MAKINDGGQAFPSNELDQDGVPNGWQHRGLSIRDWFAGQALSGICADSSWTEERANAETAKWAYKLADAMIAEREKTNAKS